MKLKLPALPRVDDGAFWLATLTAMAASWVHLAQWFARYEYPDWWPVGALAATALDLGILAGMRKVREWAKSQPDAAAQMRQTVLGLTLASSAANYQHAWAVGSVDVVGRWPLFGVGVNALLVSAILPIIVYRFTHALELAQDTGPAATSGATSDGLALTVEDPLPPASQNGHVPAALPSSRPARRKPTDADVAEWRRMADEGLGSTAIGKATDWPESTVRAVLAR